MPRKSRHTIDPTGEATVALTPNALTKQEFGRRLGKVIREAGLSQSDLARMAGVGRDAISGYVNGHAFPTPKSLEKVVSALGLTREDLLPNSLMSAMDEEIPAFEMKVAAGHPDKAWVRVNRAMSFETAAEIARLLNVEDQRQPRTDH